MKMCCTQQQKDLRRLLCCASGVHLQDKLFQFEWMVISEQVNIRISEYQYMPLQGISSIFVVRKRLFFFFSIYYQVTKNRPIGFLIKVMRTINIFNIFMMILHYFQNINNHILFNSLCRFLCMYPQCCEN